MGWSRPAQRLTIRGLFVRRTGRACFCGVRVAVRARFLRRGEAWLRRRGGSGAMRIDTPPHGLLPPHTTLACRQAPVVRLCQR